MPKTVLSWIESLVYGCVLSIIGCFGLVGLFMHSVVSEMKVSGIKGCGSSGTISQTSSLMPRITVSSTRWFIWPAGIMNTPELVYVARLESSRKIPADSVLVVFQGAAKQGKNRSSRTARDAPPIFSESSYTNRASLGTIPADTTFTVEIHRSMRDWQKDDLDSLLAPGLCPTSATVVPLAAKQDYLGVTAAIRSDTARMLDSIRARRPLQDVEVLLLKNTESAQMSPYMAVAVNTTGRLLRHQELRYSYIDSSGRAESSRGKETTVYENRRETTTIDSLLPHEARALGDGLLFVGYIKSSVDITLVPEEAKPEVKQGPDPRSRTKVRLL